MVGLSEDFRVVVAGTEGRTARRLAEHYRQGGAAVDEIVLAPGVDIDRAVAGIGEGPVDLLIVADDEAPPDRGVANLTREDLRAGFDRLTFAPFRIAALLRPQVAAAHALWRCFSIEWQADGIDCLLIAVREPELARVPSAIAKAVRQVPTVLTDVSGATLSW
jgi:hypothetical protein